MSCGFGKYLGTSYKDLAVEDPGYCSWLLGVLEKQYPAESPLLETAVLEALESGETVDGGGNVTKYSSGCLAALSIAVGVTKRKASVLRVHAPLRCFPGNVPSDSVGIFLDYWIRYMLSGKSFRDYRADHIIMLRQDDDYLTPEDAALTERLCKSQQAALEKTATPEDIWRLSTCHKEYFEREGLDSPYPKSFSNLLPLINVSALKQLSEKQQAPIELDCATACTYYKGDVDLVIGNFVIDIKCTKDVTAGHWSQLLLYAYAFACEGRDINKIGIFHVISGRLISFDFTKSDFDEVGRILKKRVTAVPGMCVQTYAFSTCTDEPEEISADESEEISADNHTAAKNQEEVEDLLESLGGFYSHETPDPVTEKMLAALPKATIAPYSPATPEIELNNSVEVPLRVECKKGQNRQTALNIEKMCGVKLRTPGKLARVSHVSWGCSWGHQWSARLIGQVDKASEARAWCYQCSQAGHKWVVEICSALFGGVHFVKTECGAYSERLNLKIAIPYVDVNYHSSGLKCKVSIAYSPKSNIATEARRNNVIITPPLPYLVQYEGASLYEERHEVFVSYLWEQAHKTRPKECVPRGDFNPSSPWRAKYTIADSDPIWDELGL